MRGLAADLGLRYADDVDADYLATMGPLPELPLLREGNDDSITKLIYGAIDGLDVRLFTFESASHVQVGGISRSCVLLTFEGTLLPEVFIAPKDRIPRLGEKLSEGGMAIGSPELMAKYAIQAHNPAQAVDIVSEEIESWLISCPIEGLRIEISGGAILGHVPDLPGADEVAELFRYMRGFHERIPERIWANYRKL
jgi:hypothetical protein